MSGRASDERPDPPEVPTHIVEAARHVMASDGLAAATLERISAAAGVSRMTLHRRGLSKADIVGAIGRRLERDYREAMWPALVSKGTGQERLRRAIEALCAVTEDNRATLGTLSPATREQIYHDPGPARLTRKVFVEPLERLLLDGAADGSLAPRDPDGWRPAIRTRSPRCCSTRFVTRTRTSGWSTAGPRRGLDRGSSNL